MSEKEYKIKCENLFRKNTILINQQQIDAEHIRALQKQNGELTDKVRELEAQIKNITGLLNDILWKCTCKEYEKATQDLKELINELEVKE